MPIRYATKAGTVELPKLTLRLSDMTDEVERCTDNRERYRLQHEFLSEVLGAETLAALVDGETLEDADLVALNVAYVGVVNAYAAPIVDEQAKGATDQLRSVQPVINALNKVQGAQSRQGFSAVK